VLPDNAPLPQTGGSSTQDPPPADTRRRPLLIHWPVGTDADDELAGHYAWPADAGAPTVRANMITSLDGGSTVDGRSAGLGNAQDERLFAILRDLADVILVGSGTVRAEEYGGIRFDAERLARRTRWGRSAEPPPIAVVTTRGLDAASPLFTDTVTTPIVITTETAAHLVPDGAIKIITGHDRVNLSVAIGELGVAGHRRIHCEGGPALLGSLVNNDLVDECAVTIAPLLLGAGSTALLPVDLHDPVRWDLAMAMVGGSHLFTHYRRAAPR